jgi:hypothetical protein
MELSYELTSMATSLSDKQRRTYEEDGVLFPIPVLSSAEAADYRAACDALEAHLGGRPRTIEVRQMHLHFRWAYSLATHPRVLDAVEGLLGPDLLIWATELFAKHPQEGTVAIGWHQDNPYMGFDPRLTTTAWIALSDSTAANGCMRAMPGQQRFQTTARRQASNGQRPSLEDDASQIVDVVLQAGEMSLHDSYIVHGSAPNRSTEKRVGFVVRFITPQASVSGRRPPAVLARGRDDYGHFCIVPPPPTADAPNALAEMQRSASQHLEAVLQNLKLTTS